MNGNLEPEENVMGTSDLISQISIAMEVLEWGPIDEIAVEIGGSQTYEIDGAGTKWAPVRGTCKYNKDAFIVIKNKSRNSIEPSKPNPELKARHAES